MKLCSGHVCKVLLFRSWVEIRTPDLTVGVWCSTDYTLAHSLSLSDYYLWQMVTWQILIGSYLWPHISKVPSQQHGLSTFFSPWIHARHQLHIHWQGLQMQPFHRNNRIHTKQICVYSNVHTTVTVVWHSSGTVPVQSIMEEDAFYTSARTQKS